MATMRSNSMSFSDSRNMLKPVKITQISSTTETVNKQLAMRTKKLSLDSDSFMKNLQGKYEQKQPKPPPILGLGVRRYKGSKSSIGYVRDPTTTSNDSNTQHNLKQSSTRSRIDYNLNEIKEDTTTENTEIGIIESDINEEETQTDVDLKLREIEAEAENIFKALEKDNLELDSVLNGRDGGTQSMEEAATIGDVAAMKRLIRDTNPAETKEAQAAALYQACSHGHALIASLLIKQDGDVDAIDPLGRSLLHTAVLSGSTSTVAALMEAGVKCCSRDNRRGRTALHIATIENELVMIHMLVQPLRDDTWGAMHLLTVTDKDGRTPLHVAAGAGKVEGVRLLLGVGYSVTRKDLYGLTPMHCALSLNHANKRCRLMLRMLLEAGGDLAIKEEHPTGGEDSQSGIPKRGEDIEDSPVTPTTTTDDDNVVCNADESKQKDGTSAENGKSHTRGTKQAHGDSSSAFKYNGTSVIGRRKCSDAWVDEGVEQVERMIHMAARIGCGGCLSLLIKYGAPVNSRDRRQRTPLHLAAETTRASAAAALVTLGADLEARDDRGHTPLHIAAAANNPIMIGALLDLGADHTKKDNIGRSYAEFALYSRKLEAFSRLVKRGVDGVAEPGSSILHSAAAIGCLTSTELLLSMGLDSSTADSKGLTPLHTTIGQGHEDVATLLIASGADIMQRDNKGATSLHYAVRWGGSDALLRMLVKRGASLRARDWLGRTPLHYAASKFSIMSDLYILIGGGADIQPADISGLTPLHLAARFGNESLVRILLEKGANPTLQDMDKFTPMDHATENNHSSIIKRLQDSMEKFSATKSSPSIRSNILLNASDSICKGKICNGGIEINSSGVQNGNSEIKEDKETVTELRMNQKRDQFKARGHRTSVAW